jgi:Mg2+-importing ATPase
MKKIIFSKDALFWNLSTEAILTSVKSTDKGLTTEEAEKRQAAFGLNLAVDVHHTPLWLQFLQRLRNPLVILLLIASGFAAITGDIASFVIIMIIVLVSICLDFFQEVRAERTVDALRNTVAVTATVLRDGNLQELLVKELVPGDVVLLHPGDLVPADGRLLTAKDLFINQALLTGESFPAEKNANKLPQPSNDPIEAINSVFMGTSVISGTATMMVTLTGKNTRIGGLANTLGKRPPVNDFEQGVQNFGMLILRFAITMVLFVLLVNILFARPLLESFLFALALAVGLTPELLPMIMTITLARGAQRMAEKSVIVKHLPAMHNLGAMNVLCTDKTGTLTEAKIKLIKTFDTTGAESERVFLLGYINSFFSSGVKAVLDTAILEHHQPDIHTWEKLDEVPFDFERRRVSVLAQNSGKKYLIVKGAPEDIFNFSSYYETPNGEVLPLTADKKQENLQRFEQLGTEGLRVLGVAIRTVVDEHTVVEKEDEKDLTFVGLIAFLDPPKADAAETLQNLANVGIKIKIITGDNELVTRHLCNLMGWQEVNILTGNDLTKMTDEALIAAVDNIQAFCRINPQQKSRIIHALRANKHVVGFLGDGINDAVALHEADVGISVDSATDVAKEAASIILMKHDLSVIYQGVIEGRRAVVNTEKYILMGSSSNFGNMFSMAGAVLFLPFLPMLPIQILLNNLLYTFSQTSIPFDNVDAMVLSKPIHWNMQKIKRFMLVLGPVSSIFDFLTFYILLKICAGDPVIFHSGWFVESILTQVLIVFAIRTRHSLFRSKPSPLVVFSAVLTSCIAVLLPYTLLGEWFGLTPMPGYFYLYLLGIIVLYFTAVEWCKAKLGKYIYCE